MAKKEQVYTVEEVAEFLKTSPRVIRRMIDKKTLKAFKVGREYRIWQHDLDKVTQADVAEEDEEE